jgi:hypothetical protein
MTLRDMLKEQLTQPHWCVGQPSGYVRASVDDLITDIMYAVDLKLKELGYEALRKEIKR